MIEDEVEPDGRGEVVSLTGTRPGGDTVVTLVLLAAPAPLAHISGLRLCPDCVGGIRPEAFEPMKGSDLERAIGPECSTCGGTGIDPTCFEGCCDGEEHGRDVDDSALHEGAGFHIPGA